MYGGRHTNYRPSREETYYDQNGYQIGPIQTRENPVDSNRGRYPNLQTNSQANQNAYPFAQRVPLNETGSSWPIQEQMIRHGVKRHYDPGGQQQPLSQQQQFFRETQFPQTSQVSCKQHSNPLAGVPQPTLLAQERNSPEISFPHKRNQDYTRLRYPQESLPMDQGIQTPIPVFGRGIQFPEEQESYHPKASGSSDAPVPGTRPELSSAFKPYHRIESGQRHEQSECKPMFHSQYYNLDQYERRFPRGEDPFSNRLHSQNQYNQHIANRDRFIIPIREPSQFDKLEKMGLIVNNKVKVIMGEEDEYLPSASNSDTRKPLETLEMAEKDKNKEKLLFAKKTAHRFDDASKQIIIPAPSKIKVRVPHGQKHSRASHLATMLNQNAAGASNFDVNSYLVNTMLGGVGGMNPMMTSYQQHYLLQPTQPLPNVYGYIPQVPQYINYAQSVEDFRYTNNPQNEYGGTYFQVMGINNDEYPNNYLQQSCTSETFVTDAVQPQPTVDKLELPRSPVTNLSQEQVVQKAVNRSTPGPLLDMPIFVIDDPSSLSSSKPNTQRQEFKDKKPSMKAEVQRLQGDEEAMASIAESEVIQSKMQFPEHERMSTGNSSGSDKTLDRMSTNGTSAISNVEMQQMVDIDEEFEDFLQGTKYTDLHSQTKNAMENSEQDIDAMLGITGVFNDILPEKERGDVDDDPEIVELKQNNEFNIQKEDDFDDFIAELLEGNVEQPSSKDRKPTEFVVSENEKSVHKQISERETADNDQEKYGQDAFKPIVESLKRGDGNKEVDKLLTAGNVRLGEHEQNVFKPIVESPKTIENVQSHDTSSSVTSQSMAEDESNSTDRSEDFYSELLEDLLGQRCTASVVDNKLRDLSSNCDHPARSSVDDDESPTHSLHDLVREMGSSVSSILGDILSNSS